MESLSELQNPLLDSVQSDYQAYQCDFPSPPHRDDLLGCYYYAGAKEPKSQQVLDAASLHLAVEAFYGPSLVLYKDDVSLHSKDSKSESLETTFTETKDAAVDGEPAAATPGEKDVTIQTVSYEVEDEPAPEYEVRAETSAIGTFQSLPPALTVG